MLEFKNLGSEKWLENNHNYVQQPGPPVLYKSLNEYVEPWEIGREVRLGDREHEHEWTFSL